MKEKLVKTDLLPLGFGFDSTLVDGRVADVVGAYVLEAKRLTTYEDEQKIWIENPNEHMGYVKELASNVADRLDDVGYDVRLVCVNGSFLGGGFVADLDMLVVVDGIFDGVDCCDDEVKALARQISPLNIEGQDLKFDLGLVGMDPGEELNYFRLIPWQLMNHRVIYNKDVTRQEYLNLVIKSNEYVKQNISEIKHLLGIEDGLKEWWWKVVQFLGV